MRVALVVVAGCGRIHFAAVADAPLDAPLDVPALEPGESGLLLHWRQNRKLVPAREAVSAPKSDRIFMKVRLFSTARTCVAKHADSRYNS